MTDLDQALSACARRWADAEPPPPDLDEALILVRRTRRRHWPVLLAAACTLALAVGLVVATRTEEHAPRPAAGAVSNAEVLKLRQIALSAAIAGGDLYASAVAVRTTVRRYESLEDGKDPGGDDGPIWVIQLHGDHLIDVGWMGPRNGPPPAPYLLFSVPIGRTHTGFDGTSKHALDLAKLGVVIQLLKGGSLPPEIARLRRLAVATAGNNGDPHARAEAVRTTYAAANALADAGVPAITDRAPVWLLQISGDFECNTCRGPGPQPRGHYITMTVPVRSGQSSADGFFNLTDTRLDLSKLGTVVTLR